jgi:pimeloyl-[acyl-carrier protein] methyl ester esterase
MAKLARIQLPTLIIHGDADNAVSYEAGQYLANHIPKAKFLTYDNIGHLLLAECPQRFYTDVHEFSVNFKS